MNKSVSEKKPKNTKIGNITLSDKEYKRDKRNRRMFLDEVLNEELITGESPGNMKYKIFHDLKKKSNIITSKKVGEDDIYPYHLIILDFRGVFQDDLGKFMEDVLTTEFNGFELQHTFAKKSSYDFGVPKVYESGRLEEYFDPKERAKEIKNTLEMGKKPLNTEEPEVKWYAICESFSDTNLFKFIHDQYNLDESKLYGKKDRKIYVNKEDEKQQLALQRKKMFYNMLRSVKLLHDEGYVHMDLSVDKFLIDREKPERMRLVDFSFTTKIEENLQTELINKALKKTREGFLSPQIKERNAQMELEAKRNPIKISKCMDIFCLGNCFLYILIGRNICTESFFDPGVRQWGCADGLSTIQNVFNNIEKEMKENKNTVTENEKTYLFSLIRRMLMDTVAYELYKNNKSLLNEKESEREDCYRDHCCIFNDLDEIMNDKYFKDDEEFQKYLTETGQERLNNRHLNKLQGGFKKTKKRKFNKLKKKYNKSKKK